MVRYVQRLAVVRSPLPIPAAALVILGILAQELGASLAITLFPIVGPFAMVSLRLGFSAFILLAIFRPRLRGRSKGDWLMVVAFGLTLATMNSLFYAAIARLPLGATVTIEILGPLILSVVASKKRIAWLWALLAFGGVFLLGKGGLNELDLVGALCAFGAGSIWVAYILLSANVGRRFSHMDGLTIAMVIGAMATIPLGASTTGARLLSPMILMLGLVVALLSSALPYAFELVALRRLPPATFSILLSLAPAIAALAGFTLLGQTLDPLQAAGILLVVGASVGAVQSVPRIAQLNSPNPPTL